MQKLSIVIPAYNEENTLEILISKVLDVTLPFGLEKEIIIVNDGSKDKTLDIMGKLSNKYSNIKIFNNEKNLGKSQTVRNGILKTTGDYVIIQDADLEYNPEEIVDLINVLVNNNLDVVYGNRFGKKNKVIYWQNYFGNISLSFISNLFTYFRIHTWIPDMEVCYKLMKGDIARNIGQSIKSTSTFGLEPEITAKISKYKLNNKHLKLKVVPISYFPRSIAEGKKMSAIKDGFKALKEIFIFNM